MKGEGSDTSAASLVVAEIKKVRHYNSSTAFTSPIHFTVRITLVAPNEHL